MQQCEVTSADGRCQQQALPQADRSKPSKLHLIRQDDSDRIGYTVLHPLTKKRTLYFYHRKKEAGFFALGR